MSGNKVNSSSGQILLLLILILGTVVVIASISMFQTTTSIQTTSANQVAQQTISAAEAGLEKSLSRTDGGTFRELELTNLTNINLDQSVVEIKYDRVSEFNTSSDVTEGEQYTFYLSDYNMATNLFSNPYSIQFYVYYDSPAGSCIDTIVDMTLVYDTNGDGILDSKKLISDASGTVIPTAATQNYFDTVVTSPVGDISGHSYKCRTNSINTSNYPNARFLLVQLLNGSSKVGFGVVSSGQFPVQGRTITSTARALVDSATPGGESSNTTRSVSLFQSYPQIPASLWNTRY